MNWIERFIDAIVFYTVGYNSYVIIEEVISGDTFRVIDTRSKETFVIKLANVVAPTKGQYGHQECIDFAKTYIMEKELRIETVEIKDNIYHVNLYYMTSVRVQEKNMKKEVYYQAVVIKAGLVFLKDNCMDAILRPLYDNARKQRDGIWHQGKVEFPFDTYETIEIIKI